MSENTLEKGICRLSIVPVRSFGSDKSEMSTQLLFGDHYTVLEYTGDKKWLKIKIYFDGQEGWIDSGQHCPISEEYFEHINTVDYKITLDVTSVILFRKQPALIMLGSILPIASNELFTMEEQLAYNGESKSLSQKRDFEFLKSVAAKFLNTPYLWGGKTPAGIDASGFTQQVFKICGYKLPRDVHGQLHQGEVIGSLAESSPGDLAFFRDGEKKSHVGIILEDNRVIHACGKVKIDKIDEAGIFQDNLPVHTHKLTTVTRILK